MTATFPAGADVLARMDEAKLSRLHWKIMFISGMGFFTDAYDLFIIGVVMALLKSEWHISPTEEGLVASTALLASAFGAILFGRVADMLGRKRIYGYEVLVLAFGAVASALSPNIWWLILFRVILGVGIGGDYPVSSTIMSEYASKKTRGMMVTLVFTMQAAGLIFGPLLAAALLMTPMSHDLIWRILLAFGAVPAMAVFQMRRHMAETPRYLLATGQHKELGEATTHMLAKQAAAPRRPMDDAPPRKESVLARLPVAYRQSGLSHAAHRGEPRLGVHGLRLLRQHGVEPDGARRDQPGQEPVQPYADAACDLRHRRRARLPARRRHHRPHRAQGDPDRRFRDDGGSLRRDRLHARRRPSSSSRSSSSTASAISSPNSGRTRRPSSIRPKSFR